VAEEDHPAAVAVAVAAVVGSCRLSPVKKRVVRKEI